MLIKLHFKKVKLGRILYLFLTKWNKLLNKLMINITKKNNKSKMNKINRKLLKIK
jgi:hypothetical protein